jgi:hypothetical protein
MKVLREINLKINIIQHSNTTKNQAHKKKLMKHSILLTRLRNYSEGRTYANFKQCDIKNNKL